MLEQQKEIFLLDFSINISVLLKIEKCQHYPISLQPRLTFFLGQLDPRHSLAHGDEGDVVVHESLVVLGLESGQHSEPDKQRIRDQSEEH